MEIFEQLLQEFTWEVVTSVIGTGATILVKKFNLRQSWMPAIKDGIIIGVCIFVALSLFSRVSSQIETQENAVPAPLAVTEEKLLLSAEHMLDYECPMMQYDGANHTIRLGCRFTNKATFPIEFDVQAIITGLEGKYSPRKSLSGKTNSVLSPGADKQFEDFPIKLEHPFQHNKKVPGFIHIDMKYGHPGELNHDLGINVKVLIWVEGNAIKGKMYE